MVAENGEIMPSIGLKKEMVNIYSTCNGRDLQASNHSTENFSEGMLFAF